MTKSSSLSSLMGSPEQNPKKKLSKDLEHVFSIEMKAPVRNVGTSVTGKRCSQKENIKVVVTNDIASRNNYAKEPSIETVRETLYMSAININDTKSKDSLYEGTLFGKSDLEVLPRVKVPIDQNLIAYSSGSNSPIT